MNRSQIDSTTLCQACTVLGLALLNLAEEHSILTICCIFNNHSLEMSALVSHQSVIIVFFAVVKPIFLFFNINMFFKRALQCLNFSV